MASQPGFEKKVSIDKNFSHIFFHFSNNLKKDRIFVWDAPKVVTFSQLPAATIFAAFQTYIRLFLFCQGFSRTRSMTPRFLLLAHVGKKVKNFTGAHMCTQTQLIMNNLSPTNMPIIKNQVQFGAFKV